MIDIELFTQLLPGPEGAANLCHGVVIVINAVWHRVFRLWLALSRVLHCDTRHSMTYTYEKKCWCFSNTDITLHKDLCICILTLRSLWDSSTSYQRTAEALITSLTWWFSRQLLWFLAWCKLLGISQRAEEGSKGVAGDVLVVVALVCHLTGAQHSHSIQDPSLREQCGHDK